MKDAFVEAVNALIVDHLEGPYSPLSPRLMAEIRKDAEEVVRMDMKASEEGNKRDTQCCLNTDQQRSTDFFERHVILE